MTKHIWKGLMMTGLLGLTGLAVGCDERREVEVREEAREVGQEVEGAGREAGEDIREGVGGGSRQGVDIGENEGVIDDEEGAFEQQNAPGEDNVLQDDVGPLEENR